MPNFRFVVVDLGKIDNITLSANPTLRVGLLVLKYVFRKKDQDGILETIGLALQYAPDIMYQVLRYIILTYENADHATINKLIQMARPEEETKMMSKFAREILSNSNPKWANMIHEDGEKKGEATMLTRMLQRRFGAVPAWATEKIAQAEMTSLEEWGLRFVDAQSLDEVFADPV